MDRLDKFVEDMLLPEYTREAQRKRHPEYMRLTRLAYQYRKTGKLERAEELRKEAQQYPSVAPEDPEYRRRRYVRYADDFLLGFSGPKAEAEEIKQRLTTFLGTKLHLTLAAEKTLLTHALTGKARFLGYEIGIMKCQTKFDDKRRRVINGKVGLDIPEDVIQTKRKRYLRDGKVMHRTELINESEYDIIYRYQGEYRGLVDYYGMAQNLTWLNGLKWVMETSLLKTLASKNRTTVVKTCKRLRNIQQTPNGPRTCLKLIVPREGKKPLVAIFGGLSLRQRMNTAIKDQVIKPYIRTRSEVVDKLLHDTCELCGAKEEVHMHHIRKLADLKKKGRKEKPYWMQIMIARKRKTLAVCRKCHEGIHHNRPRSKREEGNRRAG